MRSDDTRNDRLQSKGVRPALLRVLDILLIIAIIVGAVGFATDLLNTVRFGGADLRNRVVGARVMMEGLDPYHFKWTEGDSPTLLDPLDDPAAPVTRVTVPPTVLLLHAPLARLPYQFQRVIWFALQWAMLLLSIVILAGACPSATRRKAAWTFGLLLISGHWFWRLHVERGQTYILYTFLLLVAFALWRRRPRSQFAAGAIVGLTAALRPPVLIMAIPMALQEQRRALLGMLLGFAVTMAVAVPLTGVSVWQGYRAAMEIWGNYPNGLQNAPAPASPAFPRTVEGRSNWRDYLVCPAFDPSLQALLREFSLDSAQPGARTMAAILLTFLAAMVLLLRRVDTSPASPAKCFLVGATLLLAAEFLLPGPRCSYNNILWLIPFGLLLARGDVSRLALSPLNLLLVFGLLMPSCFEWVPHALHLSEWLMALYALLMMVYVTRNGLLVMDPNSEETMRRGKMPT